MLAPEKTQEEMGPGEDHRQQASMKRSQGGQGEGRGSGRHSGERPDGSGSGGFSDCRCTASPRSLCGSRV